MSPHDWNAPSYDRVATGVVALGSEVLDRLPLRGDETVLDAGCGAGGVTEQLIERLPQGRVIAVDASPAMVELAAERFGDLVDVFVADLVELELDAPVDAVLSTATLHWIADPGFARAVAQYLDAETRAVGQEIEVLTAYGPFRRCTTQEPD